MSTQQDTRWAAIGRELRARLIMLAVGLILAGGAYWYCTHILAGQLSHAWSRGLTPTVVTPSPAK